MTSRAKVLKQLVDQSLYVADDALVAEAILLRAALRNTLPGVQLCEPPAGEAVRSFRRDARARSFRLAPRRGAAAVR